MTRDCLTDNVNSLYSDSVVLYERRRRRDEAAGNQEKLKELRRLCVLSSFIYIIRNVL